MLSAFVAASALLLPAAAPEPETQVDRATMDFSAGFGARNGGGAAIGGWLVSFDADAFWSLSRWLSLGASVGAGDTPWSRLNIDCLGPCPSPDAFYSFRAGPAARLTTSVFDKPIFLQLSPQWDLELEHFPSGPSRSDNHFFLRLETGVDFALSRYFGLGPRAWVEGPDLFGFGAALAFSIRA